jgi:murein L,D-transpeptidase YcbB/YkuD
MACWALGLGLAPWVSGCAPGKKTEIKVEDEIRDQVFVRGATIGLTDTVGAEPAWKWLEHVYQERGYRPFWSNGRRVKGQATKLLDAIRATADAGLDPTAYDADRLIGLMSLSNRTYGPAEMIRPRTLARFDVLATYETYRIAQHLREGRVPRVNLDPDWSLDTLSAEQRDRLKHALGDDPSSLFADLEPKHPGYRRLRIALARHRAIAAEGVWPEIDAGPPLKLGDHGPRVRTLIRRMVLSGDARPARVDSLFDARLEQAVGNFQSRLGIPVSGVVGEATRAALNVPVERRIRQIELNLERWRWLPDSLGQRHVEVNIPAYRLELVRRGQITRAMRVVVGRKRSPTPVFSDHLVYVEVNPTWTLPPSVVRKEIVPALKKDRDYLVKNRMHVISIADSKRDTVDAREVRWKDALSDSFSYLVIQDAGPENPLGSIKLMCPNEYDVYLHDTPMRSRFSVAVRDYSHGCVRVEHAIELADSLMLVPPQDSLRLDSLVALGDWKRMRLPEPVPVHFVYWTAWIDASGRLNYRDDIYALDERLNQALRNRRTHELVVNPGVEISPFWAKAEARADALRRAKRR